MGGREWSPAVPARYIAQVIQKLSTGYYPRESVRCFCGADFNDTTLVERDRFTIPHRMVMCNECALIRANPRMTKAAYEEFYNEEYRPIYDGWEFGENGQNDHFIFMRQAEDGVDFKTFLKYFGIKPRVLIDIGCNMGGFLVPFKEEGATVYGVEINRHSIAYGKSRGLSFIESIEEAIAKGIKADVIVLEQSIEHYLDLEQIGKLHKLLAPKGVLYIGTPGLFRAKLATLFQNAHTYQFIGETLNYVLSRFGFEPIYLDENIHSLWGHEWGQAVYVKKPQEWIRYIVEHLEQKEKRVLPPIRGINKFTAEEIWNNIDANLAYGYPDIRPLIKTYSGEAIIIGGGPSVDGELPAIKNLIAKGHKLIVIERMYPWCSQVGLKPDFVIALDGSNDVSEGFTSIQPDTVHFLGTATHPDAAKLLKGYKVYFYSGNNPFMDIQNLWHRHGYKHITAVNTGGSVTLAAMYMGLTLGFRRFHIFGFDCKVTAEQDYARGIAGKGVPREYFPVEIEGGKTALSCMSFLSFVKQFFAMAETARRVGMLDAIDVYGDSLINDLWKKPAVEDEKQWLTLPPATPLS